jgi:hypothetical protein
MNGLLDGDLHGQIQALAHAALAYAFLFNRGRYSGCSGRLVRLRVLDGISKNPQ